MYIKKSTMSVKTDSRVFNTMPWEYSHSYITSALVCFLTKI